VTTLNTKAQTLSADLNVAAKSSDALRQQLDKAVEQLVAQASGVEQQIAANAQQLTQINAQIQQTNAQLVDAQNQVNAAAKSVQDAQNALNQEQRRVHKAEHCLIGGWLGHHLCHLVNHDGVKHAVQARDHAQADLAGRQQRLAQFQTLQAQLKAKQASSQQSKSNLEATKASLNTQLAQLNQARNNVNTVDTGLKAVVAHVTTLFGKSQVLTDVIKNLIDLETVIKPLTAIADQIISFTTNVADVNYLNAMKQKITVNLPLVQKKLPQYALIPPA
jgi:chromosome segregation ATPase